VVVNVAVVNVVGDYYYITQPNAIRVGCFCLTFVCTRFVGSLALAEDGSSEGVASGMLCTGWDQH
jgi:hypothetical protein